MTFALSRSSIAKMKGVHPDLVRVVKRAITLTLVDFAVTEGLRSKERQYELVAAGASWTIDSRHLTGHAVDVAAIVGGKAAWDWPLYSKIAAAMKDAAKIEKVPIEWGGDWSEKRRDGPHFQLPRKAYP